MKSVKNNKKAMDFLLLLFCEIWLDQHLCSERESNIRELPDSPDSNQTFTVEDWLPAGEDQEVNLTLFRYRQQNEKKIQRQQTHAQNRLRKR
jgi:hypothetical protein